MQSFLSSVLAGVIAAVVFIACAGQVGDGDPPSASSKATIACQDLTTICATTGRDCLAQSAFCGVLAPELTQVFASETACKTACATDVYCLKTCKADRVGAVTSLLTVRDLNSDGTAGDGLSACQELSTTCTSSGDGCSSAEFLCSAARIVPPPDSCAAELATCREACGADRPCKRACRVAYRACEAATAPAPDAGTPPAPTPDAATPPPPPPPPPAPTFTYTTDIKPVTSGYCTGCHSGSGPDGNYDLSTFQGLFGNGTDNTPNVIAGNTNSKFVVYVKSNHKSVLTLFPGFDNTANDWVLGGAAQ
ncbi:MAG: hypothetical protein H6Q90_2970 [Deltaproteobacteria bacterium]|nr:hypothetical protein [Deltaproteobacteria bacterium]